MKFKLFSLVSLALLVAGCSLAEDVTPPPALATAQAAPVQGDAVPVRPAAQATNTGPVELGPPEIPPNLLSGAAIYTDSCEPCHGVFGLGDGSMSSNLEVEPPPLGDLDYARAARPLDWYGVVTEGRMDRFMPPFRSLSDSQRWDVVAYALSLSDPQETIQHGVGLYADSCEACHGAAGQGTGDGPPLNTSTLFAERALDDVLRIIQEGKGGMPTFGELLPEEDQLVLAAYVRSLATAVDGGTATTADQPSVAGSPDSGDLVGAIRGVVVNGTEGMALPESLDVTVIGMEGNTPVIEQDVPVDQDGNFSLPDLDIVPGRIYGALVEYQDVIYFSVAGHLLEETPVLDLPLVIYETTPDDSQLSVERLHVIFDFSVEGFVEVSELWLLSTGGDRTVVQNAGANALPIQLPDGFDNLRFGNAVSLDQFTLTEDGFVLHEPIRPGEPLELVFTFMLPYERSLDFTQPIDFPVQAAVLLTQSDAPELQGQGVEDLGERDMGGIFLHSYAMTGLEAGENLTLTLRGAHPLKPPGFSTSNLAIGLGVFGVVLVVVGLVW
ncbi:MAG TPA: c-type cytochrome [Anaerolineales bacterium]|nr:c-type cytochrome [Anaerolineales bacterium]